MVILACLKLICKGYCNINGNLSALVSVLDGTSCAYTCYNLCGKIYCMFNGTSFNRMSIMSAMCFSIYHHFYFDMYNTIMAEYILTHCSLLVKETLPI